MLTNMTELIQTAQVFISLFYELLIIRCNRGIASTHSSHEVNISLEAQTRCHVIYCNKKSEKDKQIVGAKWENVIET